MNTFKAGDKVVLINPVRYTSRNAKAMEKLTDNTLVVHSVSSDGSAVFAGLPGKRTWLWRSKDLTLAYEDWEEPSFDNDYSRYTWEIECQEDRRRESAQDKSNEREPAASKKPIRRGDLVEYDGNICVVWKKCVDVDGLGYRVTALTGNAGHWYATHDEVTLVGTIRKKIKKIKNLTGAGK